MGIRYYAYAFDDELTGYALADPRSFIGRDPLADAWGFPPGASSWTGITGQALPERDMLYLDKAWSLLQVITRPRLLGESPRPAYRMFEGDVAYCDLGWDPWVRAIAPEEVASIADDLDSIDDEIIRTALSRRSDSDIEYACDYLTIAKRFVRGLAADGRGFAYLIG
ncbi:hypothetical protein [Agromyces archimandritae]|uniref:DUF1877 family protein n=1 Tax=Agromyces archimandritae TaxID=2781962 RepID=A0A975FMH6_9MICO|nr:hypothetical protein [Agromyces archimandritae]QTX04213.1 hypothetical protein G127AT_13120 [Agromyces archimandritae]